MITLFGKDIPTPNFSFKGKSDSVVGIDIGSSAIKVVEIKKVKGQLQLQTYGEIALGPYAQKVVGESTALDPDTAAQALSEVLKQANVSTKTSVMTINTAATLLFDVRLPESAMGSLASVIPNEARKYIPVPIAEVSLNWIPVPEHITAQPDAVSDSMRPHENNDREIVVAAIRNDALSQYKNISAQADIEVVQQELEIFSNIRSVLVNELSPVAIIDIGALGTRIGIVHYGIVRMFHSINRGGQGLTQSLVRSFDISFEKAEQLKRTVGLTGDQQAVVDTLKVGAMSLLSEVKATLARFEREQRRTIDKIFVTGGGARLEGLAALLAEEIEINIHIADPFSKVDNPAFLDNALKEVGPEFSIAIGAALQQLK